MKRVLLIEDEESLQKIIQLNLELENYDVVSVGDGAKALEKIEQEHFDIIILDLMLPVLSGMDILKSIRVKQNTTPVIIISAKDTSTDRLKGLKTGADDYLTKPFEIEELLIRIQNLLRRQSLSEDTEVPGIFNFGDCTLNFETFVMEKAGHVTELSQKESYILRLLIMNKNKAVSRQEILKSVWGYDVFPSTRTIDNFIASLRKRIEDNPKNPKYIRSVHGVGYKFVMPE